MVQFIENKGNEWQLSQYYKGTWTVVGYLQKEKEPSWIADMAADQETIKVAIMELSMPKIERMYEVFSHIDILIEPQSIFAMVMNAYGLQKGNKWQAEIASTIDEGGKRKQIDVERFLMCFYTSRTLREAYAYYEVWQYKRCLKDEVGNKLVDTFEMYEEEIFNFFKYRAFLETYPWLSRNN